MRLKVIMQLSPGIKHLYHKLRQLGSPFQAKKVHIILEHSSWVLDQEAQSMASLLNQSGFDASCGDIHQSHKSQWIHFTSVNRLLTEFWKTDLSNKITCSYFHGVSDDPKLKSQIQEVKNISRYITRFQVTHKRMEQFLTDAGVPAEKIMNIPIGIDLTLPWKAAKNDKRQIRKEWNIPKSAVVIGSFQKDGEGWQSGDKPKWIKGPDRLVHIAKELVKQVDNIHFLLTGPSRGYVISEFKQNNIPHTHVNIASYDHMPRAYGAIDAYIITSREEGGPKALMESMASGTLLFSTPVGQVPDVIQDGVNGYIIDGERPDINSMAHSLNNIDSHASILKEATQSVESLAYTSLTDRFTRFFS